MRWVAHTREAVLSAPATSVTLSYLEINGWLISAGGVTVLCDPVLDGALDFGMPILYSAERRQLGGAKGLVDALPPLDALLITQGLDDHAHERTLRALGERDPMLPVIAPPSAKPVLDRTALKQVTYLRSASRRLAMPYFGLDKLPTLRLPFDSRALDQTSITPRGADARAAGVQGLSVTATSGALVGPPWQPRENGYILRGATLASGARGAHGAPSIYLEPHVEFDAEELAALAPVDAVITPTSGQALAGFELVHGPAAAAALVDCLQPRWVVTMPNGNVDAAGIAAPAIRRVGTQADFKRRIRAANPNAQVLEPSATTPITLA